MWTTPEHSLPYGLGKTIERKLHEWNLSASRWDSDRWSGRFLIGVELDALEESIGPIVLWEIHRLQDGAQESKILGLAKQYFGWTR